MQKPERYASGFFHLSSFILSYIIPITTANNTPPAMTLPN
jgi:hypothetical protein